MEVAAHLGIPHGVFMGWPHRDRELMIAWWRVKANTGPNGEWMPDATSEKADPNNYDDPLRYVVSGPWTNWAEKARLDAQDAWKKSAGENPNMNGLFWTVDETD